MKLLNYFIMEIFSKNHIIYNEQSQVDYVYFIRSGEV